MKIKHVCCVVLICPFFLDIGKAKDLNLTASPTFVTVDGHRYSIVEEGGTVTFSTSPSAEATFHWVFNNGSPSTGTGTGPFAIAYASAASGAINNVVFSSSRTDETDDSLTCESKNIVAAAVLVPKFDFHKENDSPEAYNYIDTGATVSSGKIEIKSSVKITLGVTDISVGTIDSSRGSDDTLTPSSGSTSSDGSITTILKSSKATPSLKVQIQPQSTIIASVDHGMLPALYRDSFHITGYYTPNENDFSGSVVSSTSITTGTGPSRKHYTISSSKAGKSGFLKNVAIEGEGYFSDGTHAVVSNHTETGTSDPVEITSTITTNSSPPAGLGGTTPLVAGSSCATTGAVIPDHSTINVLGTGVRSADDRVSATETGGDYHIDLYYGYDKAAAELVSATANVVLASY